MTRTHQHRAYIELTFLHFGCLLAQREIQVVEQSEKKEATQIVGLRGFCYYSVC